MSAGKKRKKKEERGSLIDWNCIGATRKRPSSVESHFFCLPLSGRSPRRLSKRREKKGNYDWREATR